MTRDHWSMQTIPRAARETERETEREKEGETHRESSKRD